MIEINDVFKFIDKDDYLKHQVWYIYVLKCSNNLFYVGMSMNPYNRILQHIIGDGANFTQKHKPIEIYEIYNTYITGIDNKKNAYKEEKFRTKQLKNKFGKDSVVGGKSFKIKIL